MSVAPGQPERDPEDVGDEGIKIADNRRIDPETGAVRPGAPGRSAEPSENGGSDAAEGESDAKVAELTNDLQRLQAEFQNYRRRVERDRVAVRDEAVANALAELLPILDDLGRADEHGELVGGFKSVADSLVAATGRLGLERFGVAGDPFDPTMHEAIAHRNEPGLDEPTCVEVFQPGYRRGERIIRAAMVVVAESDTTETTDASE